jgi:hypothetical protein
MPSVKKLVLDVLKPHQPDSLEFSRAIAEIGQDYHVKLSVSEVDVNTETVVIVIEADSIDFEAVKKIIESQGGSLHSIDSVEVKGSVDNALNNLR